MNQIVERETVVKFTSDTRIRTDMEKEAYMFSCISYSHVFNLMTKKTLNGFKHITFKLVRLCRPKLYIEFTRALLSLSTCFLSISRLILLPVLRNATRLVFSRSSFNHKLILGRFSKNLE